MIEKPLPKPFLIGALSVQTGVKIETIRYYERVGLLPARGRTKGSHRSYDENHLQRLTFIRRGRELGFSISEIQALLELEDRQSNMCSEAVKLIGSQHLANIRTKIASLRNLERALTQMTATCKPGEQTICPILKALSDTSASQRLAAIPPAQ